MQWYRRRITIGLIALLLLVLIVWLLGCSTQTGGGDSSSGLPVKELSALPPEATQTYRLIQTHGPFPYEPKDGSTFGNREGELPDEPPGYYHEYTVPTPGSSDRGARRLITGSHHELYYTGDHYASFVVVDANS